MFCIHCGNTGSMIECINNWTYAWQRPCDHCVRGVNEAKRTPWIRVWTGCDPDPDPEDTEKFNENQWRRFVRDNVVAV